uniref:Reverse transcriptase domain-containing protein n=1 Tax=Pygocentrus nattereri TaxID=42514 RepID=A0AAR2IUE6_PYGNA
MLGDMGWVSTAPLIIISVCLRCPSPEVYKRRLLTQTEYNLLSTKHAENMINKLRCRTYEHGEKTGRSLAQQLRQKIANQTIAEIKDEQGNIHIDHSQINNCFFKFYLKLYASESPGDEPLLKLFFDKINTPMIDAVASNQLDEPLTKEEFLAAVKSLQNGKSPGPDGFPSEFFRTFAGELAPLLLSVYEESYNSGSLPLTMRQAEISLILKRDKNPVECSSYRPISLLNVDCKLLAKILAQRLEKILPSVISDDQTGFIKHRQLFFNTRRLFDILYSPTPPGDTEILLSLDAEKAFDRVEWDYLLYTMKKFGFSQKFIRWIEVLYASPLAAIRTNNTLSSFFKLERGTRQGCPLSPLLFSLVIEPLAILLRSEDMIKGIHRGGLEHKVSLYADDMLLYISDPMSSLPELLNALNSFSKISGYKINFEKSELMPISNVNKAAILNQFPFKINTNKFKYLGIWVTHKFRDLYNANFPPLITSMKQDFERWNLLPLCLGGRVNIIKMNGKMEADDPLWQPLKGAAERRRKSLRTKLCTVYNYVQLYTH